MAEVNYGLKQKLMKCKEIYNNIEKYIVNKYFNENSLEEVNQINYQTKMNKKLNCFDILATIYASSKENDISFEYEINFVVYPSDIDEVDDINNYNFVFDEIEGCVYIYFERKPLGQIVIDSI